MGRGDNGLLLLPLANSLISDHFAIFPSLYFSYPCFVTFLKYIEEKGEKEEEK